MLWLHTANTLPDPRGGSLAVYMAIDFLYWCGRHVDGLFVTFLVLASLRLIAGVIEAIDKGVQRYKARTGKL